MALIVFSHLFIDYAKLFLTKKIDYKKWKNKDLGLFIIDQILHMFILILTWLIIIHEFEKMKILSGQVLPNYRILLRILGFVIAIGSITYLIKYLTLKWADEIVENNSLANAGKWIGMLERVIVTAFFY